MVTKTRSKKKSLADNILGIISKEPRLAEEFRQEIKDRFGYSEKLDDVRVNLLYLLRRGKIHRKKDGKMYKYYI